MRRRWALLGAVPLLVVACTTGGTTVEGGSAPRPASTQAPASATSLVVDPSVAGLEDLHVAIDGEGAAHVFWFEGSATEGAVRHAEVGEGEIGEPEIISETFEALFDDTPVLVGPDGELCAFFDAFIEETDPSTNGFYVRCRSDAGWSEPELVAREGITSTFDPAFDASGGVFAAATTPVSSVTFEGQELSGEDADAAGQVMLAIDTEGRYHVVWPELGEEFELNHRVSTDAGATWSETEALEGTTFFVPDPFLVAASDGSVHVFYETALLFHRVWTAGGGWGEIETGPECGGTYAYALTAEDVPVAACANLEGVHLTTGTNGAWTPLETVEGSTGVPAEAIALAVGADGTRHLLWVTTSDPPELRYAAVPAA